MNGRELPDVVSTKWLAGALGSPDLVVLDASFYLPAEQRDPATEFARAHIPGARYFDIEAMSDETDPLPHMALPAATFAVRAGALGIGDHSRVVFYDQKGLFSAPRGWWLLKLYGHDAVAVLDGGLPKWCAEGRAVVAGAAPAPTPQRFTARLRPELLRDLAAMSANLRSGAELVLDARPAARFAGTAPEPRPGLRGGHIPGSRNVPWSSVLAPDQTLRDAAALRCLFAAAGATEQSRVITSCGSGVSAALLSLALYVAGLPMGALYDGSWTEWGGREDTPVEGPQ